MVNHTTSTPPAETAPSVTSANGGPATSASLPKINMPTSVVPAMKTCRLDISRPTIPDGVLDREMDALAMFEAIFPAPNRNAPMRSTEYDVVAPNSRIPSAVRRNDPTTNDTLLQPRGIAASDSADTSLPTPITLL